MDVLRVMDTHCSSHMARKHFRTLRITLQVVSFLILVHFQAKKAPQIHFTHPYTLCDVIAMKAMPPSGRAHSQVYCVQIGVNWTIGSRDTAIFVTPTL